MRPVCFLVLLFAFVIVASAAEDTFAPMRLYQGSWSVTSSDKPKSAAPDRVDNQCAQIGVYFACQQTLNGKAVALIVFVASGAQGHYKTRPVSPDGSSPGGVTDLAIDGQHWTYRWDDTEHGHSVHYRNINTFDGSDRIHYEIARSDDGVNWKPVSSGDESRIAAKAVGHR